MLPYFILGLSALAAVFLTLRLLLIVDPRKLAQVIRLVFAIAMLGLALFLSVTGRLFWGLPLIFIAAGFFQRWFLMQRGQSSAAGSRPNNGQTSDVNTRYLRMTLNHDTGEVTGIILIGRYSGRQLVDLKDTELLDLLTECNKEDAESAQLLETWLDRVKGSDWRRNIFGEEFEEKSGSGQSTTKMSLEEAREILGVASTVTAEEVREAHRRLMLKLHPDKGGTSYLAAKINQAKDSLLANSN